MKRFFSILVIFVVCTVVFAADFSAGVFTSSNKRQVSGQFISIEVDPIKLSGKVFDFGLKGDMYFGFSKEYTPQNTPYYLTGEIKLVANHEVQNGKLVLGAGIWMDGLKSGIIGRNAEIGYAYAIRDYFSIGASCDFRFCGYDFDSNNWASIKNTDSEWNKQSVMGKLFVTYTF